MNKVDSFYNRHPWNLIIGLVLVAGIFIGIAKITSPWVLVVPPILIAFHYSKQWSTRAIHLRAKGYFSGRQVRDKWIYEERRGGSVYSLTLEVENTEPGHYEIFVPTGDQWRASVPSWAQDRREEIAYRIAEGWKPDDFHMPNDLEDA